MNKNRLLLIVIPALLFSCKSEYAERMEKAQQLKENYFKVQSIMEYSRNKELKYLLQEIQQEIQFHAVVSGNEELFLRQVWED